MLIRKHQDIDEMAWQKMDGLLPAIVQDVFDGRVLMQGYMNRDSLKYSLDHGRVTFWSRSRAELWTKGDTSGNTLELIAVHADCDRDSLLVLAIPDGPSCHLNTDSCFDSNTAVIPQLAFLAGLERLVCERDEQRPEGSYTTDLFAAGVKRIAQKVGEEGVETALAATAGSEEELLNESADLIYHLLVLLRARNTGLSKVISVLQSRHGR
jgi:phosphoribosyl-ATP pyrophosphohydrolase/phosphoribosyl-AMP cyclohydrolase